MKEDEGLVNYLTNIILRPHRQIYGIEKLGPSKIVVKSHQKSLSALQSMSKNQKHIPKQMQQNYCQLIQVNRKQVTIRNQGKCIQASIYQPQLTIKQKKYTDYQQIHDKLNFKTSKPYFPGQFAHKSQLCYQNCVIFLHANSGSRLEGTQYAKHVLQYRTLCVSFDYTGSGISQGQYTTMGVNQSKDLSSVIHFIAEKYNVKKFALWGRSMGAVTGIYYLLTKYKQDVKKIRITSCILDSPFSNLQKLILQIASKKSNLPQFVFQPILKVIQKDIISKIGVNIFTEINLIQKINNLTTDQIKILNSVSFLGLASKDDKMIDCEHCEQLCTLLIPRDVRSSDLIDDKNFLTINSTDKHLMMLVQFKKQINTKGDFIDIQGDHNKPRTNQVKQKISFFIEDNFISYKDLWPQINQAVTQIKDQQKPINFAKTGLSIKTKLAFTKAVQNNALKSRKDSFANKDILPDQIKQQGSIPGHNYNLINLKDIKAKQQAKKSLSKQKQSIRNSLSKNFLLKQRKYDNVNNNEGKNNIVQPSRGLNIVSKQFNKDRIKPSQQKNIKRGYETLQNSKHYNYPNETKKSTINSNFSNLLSKIKQLENTPKTDQVNSNNQNANRSQSVSQNSASVNNSINKQASTLQEQKNQQEVIISALNLSQNNAVNQHPNLTQRLNRPQKYQDLPSDRYNRNVQSQTYVYHNKLQQSPGISTTPFDLSMDSSSNLSFDVHNSFQDQSFRKKQTSQILDATDLSIKKQCPKTPQVKISISDFKNRQQDQSNNSMNKKFQPATKKQNNFAQANTSHWNMNINKFKGPQSIRQEDKYSSKNSIQFKKREAAQTNSIHNSDISRGQSIEIDQNRIQNQNYVDMKYKNVNNVQVNLSKPQNVSNSFSQNNPVSMKQMMINNGHKGLTQSSTFNGYTNGNTFYNPQYIYPQVDQRYGPTSPVQYSTQNGQYLAPCYDKPQSSNAYYSNKSQSNNIFIGNSKSMRSSQDPYPYVQEAQRSKEYINNNPGINAGQTNIFFQQRNQVQSMPYASSQNVNMSGNGYYVNQGNIQQGSKQPIQYKKKITRLLD